MSQVIVLGDSQIVTSRDHAIRNETPQTMESLLIFLQALTKYFISIKIYHILKVLDAQADKQANIGVNLKLGVAIVKWGPVDYLILP